MRGMEHTQVRLEVFVSHYVLNWKRPNCLFMKAKAEEENNEMRFTSLLL
jgi:hypothetical protein